MLKTIKECKRIRSVGLRAELQLFNVVGLIKKVTSEKILKGGEKVSLVAIGVSVSAKRAARILKLECT